MAYSYLLIMIYMSWHIIFPGLRRGAKEVLSGKALRDIERKLFFLLVWSTEYYYDVLPLQKVIEMEHGKCSSVFVCVFVCVRVFMFMCVCVFMFMFIVCACACMCECAYVCVHIRAYVCLCQG